MSIRQRLYPEPSGVAGLVEHCPRARFVFNIGLEQRSMWRRDKHNRGIHPEHGNLDAVRVNTATQMRELSMLRGELDWLQAGVFERAAGCAAGPGPGVRQLLRRTCLLPAVQAPLRA